MENKFYDCHCHIALDGADFEAATARHKNGVDMPYVRSVLEKYKAAGAELGKTGELSDETVKNLRVAPLDERKFKILLEMFWKNEMSGKNV